MAKKIEIIKNALVVTDTVSNVIEISQPIKDMWYKEEELTGNDRIAFYDANSLNGSKIYSKELPLIFLSDAVDSSLNPFTVESFREFSINFLSKGNIGEFEYLESSANSFMITNIIKGRVLGFTSNLPINCSVQANSLLSIGDITYIDQIGEGQVTFLEGSGVTLLNNVNTQLLTDAQYSRVAIHKIGISTYRVFGELKAL